MAFWLRNQFKPMARVIDNFRSLARGDFNFEVVGSKRKDEIERSAYSATTSAEKVQNMMGEMSGSSAKGRQVVEQMRAVLEGTSERITELDGQLNDFVGQMKSGGAAA